MTAQRHSAEPSRAFENSERKHCSEVIPPSRCLHCQSKISNLSWKTQSEHTLLFCCQGCRFAYELIHELDLGTYYNWNQRKTARRSESFYLDESDLEAIDHPHAQSQFLTRVADDHWKAELHLQGLQCYACKWLCEQVIRRAFPKAHFILNLQNGLLSLSLRQSEAPSFALIKKRLADLGYRLSPWQGGQLKPWRQELIEIAVAAFCMMNVMALAFVDYLSPGVDLGWGLKSFFAWLQLLLALAAMAFAGRTFLSRAWNDLKSLRFGIDQPIALALSVGFGASVGNTIKGTGELYFDSVTMVIFLLLCARYLRSAIQRNAETTLASQEDQNSMIRSLSGSAAHSPSQWIPLADLKSGDHFKVYPGEMVLVDALLSGATALEFSFETLNGEATPQLIQPHQHIPAGSTPLSQVALCQARQAGSQSAIEQNQKHIDQLLQSQGTWSHMSETISAALSTAMIALSVAGLAFFWHGLEVSDQMYRIVAIFLVACPCAFGFAAPLAFARGALRAQQHGIVFRSQAGIEKTARCRSIVFDKTGTLTHGHWQVLNADWHLQAEQNPKIDRQQVLWLCSQLDHHSHHHGSIAIAAWARREGMTDELRQDRNAAPSPVFKEQLGRGLDIAWQGQLFEIRSSQQDLRKSPQIGSAAAGIHSFIALRLGGKDLITWTLGDCLHDDAVKTIADLRREGFQIAISSGDGSEATEQIAQILDIPVGQAFSKQDPQQKQRLLEILQRHLASPLMMVGNGYNDAFAMAHSTKNSSISVAVDGAHPSARKSADIVLKHPGVWPVYQAWRRARSVYLTIVCCLLFSVLYNAAALSFAFLGWIGPLGAAILMPTNSLILSLIASRSGRCKEDRNPPKRSECTETLAAADEPILNT